VEANMSITEKVDEDWLETHKDSLILHKMQNILRQRRIYLKESLGIGWSLFKFVKIRGWLGIPWTQKQTIVSRVVRKGKNVEFTVRSKEQLGNAQQIAKELTNHGFKCTIVKQFIEKEK